MEISTEDFDKAAEELKNAGVKVLIDRPVVRPTGKAIYFFDPEMNYIQLWARPDRRAEKTPSASAEESRL